MNDAIGDQEYFENHLAQFVDALRVLAEDAATQCSEMGSYHVPWELREDVDRGGQQLLESEWTYLSTEQQAAVRGLLAILGELPVDAISPGGVDTSSPAGSMAAMSHPAWDRPRAEASVLLRILKREIDRNAAYFA